MTYLFYCYLWCLWRPATYTAQCAKLDLSCPRTKKFCGNRRERRNKIKVYKKKTEKCVDRVIFCCTCSILYVSYYVRNHWCLLFLVGGEGVGGGGTLSAQTNQEHVEWKSYKTILFLIISVKEYSEPRPSVLSVWLNVWFTQWNTNL